ncbi:MAG: hypothetical protein IJK23_04845 [Clostridia bacterium]|nr:hypothetical protein [Clostridia bacterium]
MEVFFRRILWLFTCIAMLFTSGFSLAARRWNNFEVDPVEYPTAAVTADKLILVNYPGADEALTVGSLQGVLANTSKTQILIRDGAYEKYLPYTGAEIVSARADGSPWDASSLLSEFGQYAQGYVLCDEAGAAAAVSVAAALQAVIVPEALEEAAKSAGLEMLEDARGWDDAALRKSPYFALLSDKIAIEQPVSLAPKLVDLAVMAGAYFGYSDSTDAKAHKKTFSFLKDNAVIFGWNPVLGEYDTVRSLSEINTCLIPADHGSNYSTLSGFAGNTFTQKTAAPATDTGRAHTVCLVMSDGDNLQWMTTQYTNEKHYGSAIRGEFPLGWGVPASIGTLASPMAEYLFDNMSENDEFITHISGLGYTYPSKWTNKTALEVMAGQLAGQMKKTDTRIAAVLDDGGFRSAALDTILSQDGIDALFYFDYADYAGYKGAVRTVGGKPVISARYRLWNGIGGCSPEEIAAKINASSTDPDSLDSYSLVVIHAWSGLDSDGNFVEGGDTMRAVERLVNALGDDVRVVTPGEFVRRVAAAAN